MKIPTRWARFLFPLVGILFFVPPAPADVDPDMIGRWETSGINQGGPWKLTWEIRPDGTYFLSGLFSDSGTIGSGYGRWHTVSDVTRLSADGTYNLRDPNHMVGTGPLGAAAWTRVTGDASAASAGASPSVAVSPQENPFAHAFTNQGTPSATPPALSHQEDQDLMNDWFNASHNKESRDRLEKKARSGIAQAEVLFGMELQTEKNFAESLVWYRKAAEQGEASAMRNLGVCYRDGMGVAKDAAEAMKWFRKAADFGNKSAPADVGNLYQDGAGVAKDEATAVEWYRKGAARGDPNAMNELGACYWAGSGVAKSAREAISWWKQAADKGDKSAQNNLKMALEKFDESGQPRTQK